MNSIVWRPVGGALTHTHITHHTHTHTHITHIPLTFLTHPTRHTFPHSINKKAVYMLTLANVDLNGHIAELLDTTNFTNLGLEAMEKAGDWTVEKEELPLVVPVLSVSPELALRVSFTVARQYAQLDQSPDVTLIPADPCNNSKLNEFLSKECTPANIKRSKEKSGATTVVGVL